MWGLGWRSGRRVPGSIPGHWGFFRGIRQFNVLWGRLSL